MKLMIENMIEQVEGALRMGGSTLQELYDSYGVTRTTWRNALIGLGDYDKSLRKELIKDAGVMCLTISKRLKKVK